jgi:acyl-CoA synthetase (AMP-forming)/AMP-acid ligase II
VQARLCPKVTIDYGATETGVIACGNYNVLLDVPDAVGFPVPGAIVEIVDENDQPLPAGQDGRVRCRTSYFVNAIAANFPDRANAINDLWWYPGDFGHLTDGGILCVKGRAAQRRDAFFEYRNSDACRMRLTHAISLKLEKLERAKGFEPSTPTLARSCSTPELHPHP